MVYGLILSLILLVSLLSFDTHSKEAPKDQTEQVH